MTLPSPIALVSFLPQFAQELKAALRAQQRNDVAEQIDSLSVVDRCRCGDGRCATFYTAPRPAGAYGPGHDSIIVDDVGGFVVLDLVDGRIRCVEVLSQPDVRDALHSLLP